MAPISRPHEGASPARLTVAPAPKSVGSEDDERVCWPSMWLGDLFFSSVSYQRPARVSCCLPRLPVYLNKIFSSPPLFLYLSPATFVSSFSTILISHFIFMKRSIPLCRPRHTRTTRTQEYHHSDQRRHICARMHRQGESIEVYARANPRIPCLVGGNG